MTDRTRDKCCGETESYHEKFDAYYCAVCYTWKETMCPDKDCTFCADRPEKPPEVT